MSESITYGKAVLRLGLGSVAALVAPVFMVIVFSALDYRPPALAIFLSLPIVIAVVLALTAFVFAWFGRRESTDVGARRWGIALGVITTLLVSALYAFLIWLYIGFRNFQF